MSDQKQIWQGKLESLKFPDLILQISRRKETGVLKISDGRVEKSFCFQEGKIVFARSNDPDERLGILLLRRNKVTYRQLEECAPKVTPGKRLGTVLVLENHIQPDDLYHGVVDQIKEIIYSTFEWDRGTFRFEPGEVPDNEVITLNLSTPDVVLAGIRRIWRWSWVKKGVVSLDTVFRKREGWSPIVRKMTMTPEVDKLLEVFDRPRTLEEILQKSPVGDFDTCKIVWAFLITGVIEEILSTPDWYTPQEPWQVQDQEIISAAPAITPITLPTADTQPAPTAPVVKNELNEIQIPEDLDIQQSELTIALADADAVEPEQRLMNESPEASENEEELSFADLAELTDSKISEIVSEPLLTLTADNGQMRLEKEIALFNEKQRFIFEMVRLDMGDQTPSFLSRVFLKAFARYPLVFEGVSINEFGEFNARALAFNVEMNLVKNYWEALTFLLQEERELIGVFMDGKRSQAVNAGLQRIDSKHKASALQ